MSCRSKTRTFAAVARRQPCGPVQIEKLFHALAEERPGREHAGHRRSGKPQSGMNLERLAVPFRVYDIGARDDQPAAHSQGALPSFEHDGEGVLAQLKLHALMMLKSA
jgi:hypothetical protein